MGIYGHKFDEYKINNIVEYSEFTIESSNNFGELLESLSILKEADVITINENKIIDFIKDKWHQFVEWIKGIWDKILGLVKKIKSINIKEKIKRIKSKAKSSKNESADLVTESPVTVTARENGEIIVRSYSWGLKHEDTTEKTKPADFKRYIGELDINLEDIFEKCMHYFKEGIGVEEANDENLSKATSKLGDVTFTDTATKVHNLGKIVIYTQDSVGFVEQGMDVVDRISDICDQIISDSDYISSLKSNVMKIISAGNSHVSKMRGDDNNSPEINAFKFTINKLTFIHQQILRWLGELDKGFKFYSEIVDKVDKLLNPGKDFKDQITSNKGFA